MFKSELMQKLATLALLFGVVAGCKSLQKLGSPTVLKSPDGKFQLTVPAGWRAEPGLNDAAEIQAANKLNDMYAIVLIESKSDFPKEMTLDKFTDISKNTMMATTKAP